MGAGPAPDQPYGATPPFGAAPVGGSGSPAARPKSGTKEPSLVPLWIGVAILVLGITGAGVWLVTGVLGVVDRVNQMPRYDVPVHTTVALTSGSYYVYAEYTDADFDPSPAQGVGSPTLTDGNGQSVPFQLPDEGTSQTYQFGDHTGRLVGRFQVDHDGSYVLATPDAGSGQSGTASGEPVVLAMSKGQAVLSSSVVASVFGSLGLGALSVLVGITLLVVTLVRRNRWRRAAEGPGGPPWGSPGPGGPYGTGPYAPPPYGVPGPGSYGGAPGPGSYGGAPGPGSYGGAPGPGSYGGRARAGALRGRARSRALRRIRSAATPGSDRGPARFRDAHRPVRWPAPRPARPRPGDIADRIDRRVAPAPERSRHAGWGRPGPGPAEPGPADPAGDPAGHPTGLGSPAWGGRSRPPGS